MRFDLKRFLPAAAVLLVLSAGLAGCSTSLMSDDSIDYKSAGKRPPLDIPPDLLDPASGVAGGKRAEARDTSLSDYRRERGAADTPNRPQTVLPAVAGVQLSRAGSQRFLTVDMPAADVWPVLREFWLDNGFLIAREAPEVGLVETDWAENRAKVPDDGFRNTVGRFLDTLYSTGERDKFRSRIEAIDGKTEVYISHRGLVEVYADELKEKTRWQPRPADPDLEVEFLRRLMVRLGTDQAASEQAAQAVSAKPASQPVEVVESAQGVSLRIAQGFDRAWRGVGLGLDRGGFTVEDRNRSDGVYFVRYIDSDQANEKPGFLARLFGSEDKTAPQKYRLIVAGQEEASTLNVQSDDGKALGSEQMPTVRRMLNVLRDQMLR